ncbi:MAG: hypothetical protein HOG99_23935 [Gemmatimonadetes bacterium]|jgi:enterochelin esterase-like enzyme|nr:hypothetical protein [Gemmatimonadota bacterium]MBT5590020.1 hypothetical protein [Gemmatimonadota bacterium]MBT5964608.1 hypothetical protein [Gemmatimonadota bacterium]MBT6629042.1 hypothetical protein [Gemmatimonadota bacterium]
MRIRIVAAFLWLAVLAGHEVLAQQAPTQSPVVHADQTVSLSLEAAGADSVIAVVYQFARIDTVDLARGEGGVWQATFGPLDPGYYLYSFVIDGRSATDRQNDYRTKDVWAILLIPDDPPAFYEEQDVPRGVLHHHRHRSEAHGDWRSYIVYTPPGYETGDTPLPVLYLLHGGADGSDSNHLFWEDYGAVSVIMDNLIADATSVPMIVVMPNILLSAVEARSLGFSPRGFERTFGAFPQYLREELVPAIDGAYRTRTDATGRGIAGLSFGGLMSLAAGLTHTHMFAWVGTFSPYVPPEEPGRYSPVGQEEFLQTAWSAARASLEHGEVGQPSKLLWHTCGIADGLYDANQSLLGNLSRRQIDYQSRSTDGQHTWSVWQEDLRAFTGLVFK